MRQRAICPFCSLQDWLILEDQRRGGDRNHGVRSAGARPAVWPESRLELDYDSDSVAGGSLCARGNYAIECLEHPWRLSAPLMDGRAVGWEEAVDSVSSVLASLREEEGADRLALLVGGRASLEEAHGAATFAVEVLGTPHVDAWLPEDRPALRLLDLWAGARTFSRETLDEVQTCLVVGDLFSEHPTIAKQVLAAKHGGRRNRLVVIDSVPGRTLQFADRTLMPLPGRESTVLAALVKLAEEEAAGDGRSRIAEFDAQTLARACELDLRQLEEVWQILARSRSVALLVSSLFGHVGEIDLAVLYAQRLLDLRGPETYFAFFPVEMNGLGVHRVIRGLRPEGAASGEEIIERILAGRISSLILVGADILSSFPRDGLEDALRRLRSLVVIDAYPSAVSELATAVLPAAMQFEKSGTVLGVDGALREFHLVLAPIPGARSEASIFEDLTRRLKPGVSLEPPSPAALMAAIDRPAEDVKARREACWEEASERLLAGWATGDGDRPFLCVPIAVTSHLGDGSITRQLSWPARECPEPYLELHPADANALGLGAGPARVESEAGVVALPVRRRLGMRRGVVTAPAHFPEVRRLFPWRIGGAGRGLRLGPVPVRVERL